MKKIRVRLTLDYFNWYRFQVRMRREKKSASEIFDQLLSEYLGHKPRAARATKKSSRKKS